MIWALKHCNCMCNTMGNSRNKWPITHFLLYFYWKRCLLWFYKLWWVFKKKTSKINTFYLFSYFAHYSQLILPQSASFSDAGTYFAKQAFIRWCFSFISCKNYLRLHGSESITEITLLTRTSVVMLHETNAFAMCVSLRSANTCGRERTHTNTEKALPIQKLGWNQA